MTVHKFREDDMRAEKRKRLSEVEVRLYRGGLYDDLKYPKNI